ncbi:undecaprenyl phosphate N,N'-diacetylbacillosamine 1-phosphate transferase [Kordia sp. SMS9]|uniref:sugar transferase n=1 Tax=Kordia sp. SMS9 TaxID=2282170 RepID=UPI000E0DF674|nr:sugar transferase [Kordia sp. SMS9]AXG68978.1 undecaprenyl phosphate N,N'-diacetylbacillosamine 1-phosphate transferase [Kordia sp. SMS9]
MYKKYFKRIVDILVGVGTLIVLLPLFIIVGILIYLSSKGSIFYSQDRIGKNGEMFRLHKFRSMYTNKNFSVNTQVFKNDKNVTTIGKFIRRFKIDELAQIINVINGDMSIVGPRPVLPAVKEHFDENAEHRLKVRPGLTGLSQVNGNIHLPWKERWVFDRKYVENISFVNDIKIIFKTFAVILLGEEKFKKDNE